MDYNLTSLQNISAVTKAKSMWHQTHIQKEVKEFLHHSFEATAEDRRYKWNNLTREVIHLELETVLPEILQSKLVFIIRSIGENMYAWYEYIWSMSEGNPSLANFINNNYNSRIHLTCYGGIDEKNTCQSFQLPYPEKNYNNECYDFIVLRILKYANRKPSDDITWNTKYNKTEQLLFDKLIKDNLKFVMENINDVHKSIQIRKELIRKVMNEYQKRRTYKSDRFVEACLFLINEMTESEKLDFLFKPFNRFDNGRLHASCAVIILLKMLLSSWPWTEDYLPTLETVWRIMDQTEYDNLLGEIVNKLKEDFESGFVIENSYHQMLLQKTCKRTPDSLKQNLPSKVIFTLASIYDYSSIKFIINNHKIHESKLYETCEEYIDSIKNECHDRTDDLIRKKILNEDNMGDFRKTMELVDYLLRNFNVDLADKLLDLKNCSEEEKKYFKYLNPVVMYRYFILKEKPETAETVLRWRFNNMLSKCIRRGKEQCL